MELKSIFDKLGLDGVELNEDAQVLTVFIESFLPLMEKLKSDKELDFHYLMCITAWDNGSSKEFTVAYNLHSYKLNHEVEVRVVVDSDTAVPSVEPLWRTADWHEREAFDLMGIKFDGHPDLRRILLPEDWEGHPLQKNYEVADYYRGVPVPKDKTYWE